KVWRLCINSKNGFFDRNFTRLNLVCPCSEKFRNMMRKTYVKNVNWLANFTKLFKRFFLKFIHFLLLYYVLMCLTPCSTAVCKLWFCGLFFAQKNRKTAT